MLEIGQRQPDGEADAVSLDGWTQAMVLLSALRPKEWLGVFEGHEIRVATWGLLSARLYVDGEFRDKRSPILCLDRKVPLLSGRLPTARSEVTIVHVYRRGPWSSRPEVRVGGTTVPMNPCALARDQRSV